MLFFYVDSRYICVVDIFADLVDGYYVDINYRIKFRIQSKNLNQFLKIIVLKYVS